MKTVPYMGVVENLGHITVMNVVDSSRNMKQLYLHNIRVKYAGTGAFGTFVVGELGRRYCVFAHGVAARHCLDSRPRERVEFDCPFCDWTQRRVYKCEGSCNMKFNKSGCE